MKKIAFIGLGIMGKSMARNLMKNGFELHIYARSKGKVEDVIAEGMQYHDSIAHCVKAVSYTHLFPQPLSPTRAEKLPWGKWKSAPCRISRSSS